MRGDAVVRGDYAQCGQRDSAAGGDGGKGCDGDDAVVGKHWRGQTPLPIMLAAALR